MCRHLKVCVAGGRNFADYGTLSRVLDTTLTTFDNTITLVSGGAHGADSLGERYAREHDLPLEVYPAEWRKNWKRAGYIRNTQMASIVDVLIAFWDGHSHGTAHMINEIRARGKPVFVFDYQGNRYPAESLP